MRTLSTVMLVLLLAGLSVARNSLWGDEAALWSDTIAKSPRKARAYNEFGLRLLSRGDNERAYGILLRSLELNPYQGQIYINLGLAFERLGRLDDAIRTYQKASWVQPGDPTAYYNLGVVYYEKFHSPDKALPYFLKARDLDPTEPDAHQYLSFIYKESGNRSAADQERSLYERYRHR